MKLKVLKGSLIILTLLVVFQSFVIFHGSPNKTIDFSYKELNRTILELADKTQSEDVIGNFKHPFID